MTVKAKLLSLLCFILLFVLPLTFVLVDAKSGQPMAGSILLQPTTALTASTPTPTPTINTASKSLIIGQPDAPISLIEYGDFQCPFCGQFFRQTEPQLLSQYVETGRINIEFRVETHIGQESIRAGEAAYCANDQRRFKAYHDQLYGHQNGINNGAFSDPRLLEFATAIGLDVPAFRDCLESHKYLASVIDSHAEAKSRGVTATPTVFIGTHKVVGAQPFSIYKQLIDEQL